MSEREWQEAADTRTPAVWLALVIVGGAALRFWALGSGVPFAVGVDEPAIMTTVVRMLKSGDFNPGFFEYPTGYIYAQLGLAVVRFILGTMQRMWYAVEQVGPGDFYLWGRALTAALGSASVLLLFRAGTRWGTRPALLAAALLAVLPMHVRESHFVLTDVPMTFAVVLTLLLSLRSLERQTLGALALAGAAAGLAAGIKYNGLFSLVMPLVAALAASRSRAPVAARVLVAAGACVGVFACTTPYAMLDLPAFLNGFGNQARAFRPRTRFDNSAWVLYAKHLVLSFGWPAFILALAGGVISAVRAFKGPGRARHLMLVAFVLAFGWLIAGRSLAFGRYALPLTPMLALWAGIATMSGVSVLRRHNISRRARTVLLLALTAAALVPPLVSAVAFDREFGTKTTRTLAWEWISRKVISGSRVVSEARELELPPERYTVEYVPSLAGRDPAALRATGVEAVILSSEAWNGSQDPPGTYDSLLEAAARSETFAPGPARPGPEIRVLLLGR